jgi:hypothetical protein
VLSRYLAPFAYYGCVGWRALQDTARHFKAQLAVGGVLFLLATWRRCASLPHGEACDLTDFRAGLWAVVLWVGLVFAFNLVMAPVRLHRELGRRVPVRSRVVLQSPPYDSPVEKQPRWRFHIYAVDEGIMLVWARWWTRQIPDSAMCWVQDPYGNHHVAQISRTGDSVRCIFPRDFDLEPRRGEHRVQWYARAEELRMTNAHPESVFLQHAKEFIIDVLAE